MKSNNKENISGQYDKLLSKYQCLEKNIKDDLRIILDSEGIDYVQIESRVKPFDSFWEKIERKGYSNIFDEMEDICGLRITCYYLSDLDKIDLLLNKEFNVINPEDKAAILDPTQFGYRSRHYILTIKKDWLKIPKYRNLDGLKSELQVRTISMHAWAAIQHKLAYKKKEDIPNLFMRKLFRLSALFEMADEQFETLKNERIDYIKQIAEEATEENRFDTKLPINLDNLQAFLDFYFPNRKGYIGATAILLDEINEYNISIQYLVEAYEKVKDIITFLDDDFWVDECSQTIAARVILSLTNDSYYNGFISMGHLTFPYDSVRDGRKYLMNKSNK